MEQTVTDSSGYPILRDSFVRVARFSLTRRELPPQHGVVVRVTADAKGPVIEWKRDGNGALHASRPEHVTVVQRSKQRREREARQALVRARALEVKVVARPARRKRS